MYDYVEIVLLSGVVGIVTAATAKLYFLILKLYCGIDLKKWLMKDGKK